MDDAWHATFCFLCSTQAKENPKPKAVCIHPCCVSQGGSPFRDEARSSLCVFYFFHQPGSKADRLAEQSIVASIFVMPQPEKICRLMISKSHLNSTGRKLNLSSRFADASPTRLIHRVV